MSENMFSKQCDTCKTQPAVLFFRTFNASTNSIQEEGLCPKCALKKFAKNENNELENQDIIQTINQMKSVLSDIVGHINQLEQTSIEKCHYCGCTSTDITQSQYAGCVFCYQELKSFVDDILVVHRFSIKHKGQVPQRFRTLHYHQMELEKLKQKLQASLRIENYEEAQQIQKRINKLEVRPSND